MDKLYVIKIGGNIIDDEQKLASFVQLFSGISEKKILVHGGGKLATSLAEKLGLEQQLLNGRRRTDAQTLKIVTMVYAGLINKNIVAALQANGCNAMGLTGADGNAVLSHKRVPTEAAGDMGFVGDVDDVNVDFIKSLLEQGSTPVIAPITHDGKGQLLNTNADTIAQEVARSMSSVFSTELIFSFEKAGVLRDAADDNSVIAQITPGTYKTLKEQNAIFAGMIPKLDNAFTALKAGVSKVVIGKAEDLLQLIDGSKGTTIVEQ